MDTPITNIAPPERNKKGRKDINEQQAFATGAQSYNRMWNIIVFQMWYKEYLE